ncbi:MAG: calcium-binding protein, partial [Planctomycetia bacterium]
SLEASSGLNLYAASSGGAGAAGVSSADARTTVDAKPDVSVRIGQQATLSAEGDVTITSTAAGIGYWSLAGYTTGMINADGSAAAGIAAGGNATSTWTLVVAPTVEVGSNANIHAEKRLALNAFVRDFKYDAQASAAAEALGGGDATAEVNSGTDANAVVRVLGGARVTGVEAIDVTVQHDRFLTSLGSAAEAWGLFADATAKLNVDELLRATVDADPGSVFATGGTMDVRANVLPGKQYPTLPAGDAKEKYGVTRSWNRTIDFDGDIVILPGPTPRLVVGPTGIAETVRGLTAYNVGDGWIEIGDVSIGPRAVTFSTNTIDSKAPKNSDNEAEATAPLGSVIGTDGTLFVRRGWEKVEITNASQNHLWLNGIDVIGKDSPVTVTIDTNTNAHEFAIVQDYVPTEIVVRNSATYGAPNIYVRGTIENPLGTTRIGADRGSIYTNQNGLVRARSAVLGAGKEIGRTPAFASGGDTFGQFRVDLVQSGGQPTAMSTVSGGRQTLAVRGLDRDKTAGTFTVDLGILTAGGDIDLQLLDALDQTTLVNAPAYGVVVTAPREKAPNSGSYYAYYRPDKAASSASLGAFGSGDKAQASHYRIGLLQSGGSVSISGQFSPRMDITAKTNLTVNPLVASNFGVTGRVDVSTSGDISVTETIGDLWVGRIASTFHDVALTAAKGAIVDAPGDAAADVVGKNISLDAKAGSIGGFTNDLEIDSASVGAGRLTATATADIFVQEIDGSLDVKQAVAAAGHVRLTTFDRAVPGDDIVVAADGLEQAIGGSITLQAGDDLADVQGSLLTGGTLFVSVDHRNADRDIGGKAMLGRATIQAAIVRLRGDDDDDVLDAGGIPIPVVARGFAGKDTITGGSQADELYGDDGADTIAGLGGDDLLVAGRGVGDSLSGGDGDDVIYGSPDGADADPNFNDLVRFGDVIDGGAGNDRIWGQGGADAI